jgi:hypothetical protein
MAMMAAFEVIGDGIPAAASSGRLTHSRPSWRLNCRLPEPTTST